MEDIAMSKARSAAFRPAPIGPEALKKVRDALNETQAQFADRIGIDQGTVSRWENGRLPKKGVAQALLRRVMEDIDRVHPIAVRR
jgi:DNA-binding transcriptional regulator YiaG